MTEEQTRSTAARFIQDCPEWRNDMRISEEDQLLMTGPCSRAFANWAATTGLLPQHKHAKARRFARFLEETEEKFKNGELP